jgi:energy-converting hydrogenase A subunit R
VKRVFISDCEGPISRNDNAFEATAHFVPNGDQLFAIISKYDDVLADVVKKTGYNAGDTLKLILPFLKAYRVTDKALRELSAQTLLLVAGSRETLRQVGSMMSSYIVSTSYEHYIKALCGELSFPFENTYCTRLSLDRYGLSERESEKLKEYAAEISGMPMIKIPPNAKSLEDFSEQDQRTVMKLDAIFWGEIDRMAAGIVFRLVKPVGGREKAEAIRDAAQKTRTHLSDVLYVGDSITDVEAFRLVREKDGLTISFNGNAYAVRNSDVAIQSDNNVVTAVIADLFCKLEKRQLLQVLENWSFETLKQTPVNESTLHNLSTLNPASLPKVQIVTAENKETLSRESSEFRKRVRGEAVGRLG